MTLLKPLTKRQQRSLETKQKIYDVAMKLIYQYGFDNVTINDICKHANIKVGTFYHFYSSKDEVLITYSEAEDHAIASLLNNLPDESHSMRLKKLFIERVELTTIAKTPDLSRFCRIAHIKTLTYSGYSCDRKFYQGLLREIVGGQENGEFSKDINPVQFVETCLFIADGLNSAWSLSDGKIDVIEKANQQVDTLLRILLSR